MVDNLEYRQQIITTAKKLSGCHYLWGSAGASPGFRDGADYRPGSVTFATPSLDIKSPCVHAAFCNNNKEGNPYICAGRWKKVGRTTGETDPFLITFLDMFWVEGYQVYAPGFTEFMHQFRNLTPRKVVGANITEDDGGGKTVWGEDCRFVRHFDCIGFINYVLDEATSAPYNNAQKVYGWSNDIEGWITNTQKIDLSDAPVPGDILFRKDDKGQWGHIAFLSGPETGPGGTSIARVVQAQGAAYGVHAEEIYNPNLWNQRGRLSSYFFQTGGVQTGPVVISE